MAEGLVNYVKRNPLWVLFLILIVVGAPNVAKGITLFVLYTCLSILILFVILSFWFTWRVRKAQREMGREFERQGFWGYRSQGGTQSGGQGGFGGYASRPAEGEVRVHKTGDTPEKRISNDVGDYVDFEETKH